jgi:hypothetical protein
VIYETDVRADVEPIVVDQTAWDVVLVLWMRSPVIANPPASFSIACMTEAPEEPIAIRSPISRVRCATEQAITP